MTVQELREIIAQLPGNAEVIAEIDHSVCDWKDTATRDIKAEFDYGVLYITATIKD